jgi:phosphatidylserine/phosphatidylglycerophosphate/cardiolipin synthase-like enzyme
MRSLFILCSLLLAFSVLSAERRARDIEVYFSPKGQCTEAVVRELGKAKGTVLVQAYSFTSAPIAKALVEAHKREVKVLVLLDKSQRTEKYSSATFLLNEGIAPLITGSFNFTKAAEESNAENLLVIRDASVAARYEKNWHEHEKHSELYRR